MGSDAGKAWSHLTDEFDSADTYLNRLSRKDYRLLFESVFDVLEDVAVDPDLGRSLLTPEIANHLKVLTTMSCFQTMFDLFCVPAKGTL